MEKLLSLSVAAGSVVACYLYADAVILLPICLLVLPPLFAIWFASEIASYFARNVPQTERVRLSTTVVRMIAWVFLGLVAILPLLVVYLKSQPL